MIITVVTCDHCRTEMPDYHDGVTVNITSRDPLNEFLAITKSEVCSGCLPALGAFLGLVKDGK